LQTHEKEEKKGVIYMNPLARRVSIARYSVPLVLFILMLVSTAAAAAYIVYQFNINATVEEYPKVTFWKWDTSEKKNTFEYSVNIFPSIRTIDENITYGIYCDDTSAHTCSLRISSLTSASNIAAIKIVIYNSTATILTKEWTDFSSLPTAWEEFVVAAGKKYSIHIEIEASSGATVGQTSTFTFEMKIEEP